MAISAVLYVKENYRHKGIGTQLLCTLEQHFAQGGICRLKIALQFCGLPLLPFFEKNGYFQNYIALKKRIHPR